MEKKKHYPITICGHKAVYTVEIIGWNSAKITFKFKHRRGQKVVITHLEDEDFMQIDNCIDYTTVKCFVNTSKFSTPDNAVYFCKTLIDTVDYAINFDAGEHLVTKELEMLNLITA